MGSYVPNTSRRVLGILLFFQVGSLCLAAAAISFFPIFLVFIIFSTRLLFELYLLGSFLYFKELIVAKNYNIFSALSGGVTKRGNATAERGNENSQRGNGKIPGFRA